MEFATLTMADWASILAGALAFVFGGILKGATGAGAPVVIVPVIALLFDVPTAVVLFAIPNLLTNIWQGWSCRDAQVPGAFPWLFATGGFLGALTGTIILASAAPDNLSVVMAAVVFVYVGFRLARPEWRLHHAVARWLVLPAGLIAGVLQGSTGISAPVSVTFINAMRLQRRSFMAVMSVFFLSLACAQIPLMVWFGLMDHRLGLLGLLAVLPMVAGMPLGALLGKRIPAPVFDRVILLLLTVIAMKLVSEQFL